MPSSETVFGLRLQIWDVKGPRVLEVDSFRNSLVVCFIWLNNETLNDALNGDAFFRDGKILSVLLELFSRKLSQGFVERHPTACAGCIQLAYLNLRVTVGFAYHSVDRLPQNLRVLSCT
jgi:hypothetical protein